MKSPQAPSPPAAHTADVTVIGSRPLRAGEAVIQKAEPQRISGSEYGSGWYHDAAIQHLKETH